MQKILNIFQKQSLIYKSFAFYSKNLQRNIYQYNFQNKINKQNNSIPCYFINTNQQKCENIEDQIKDNTNTKQDIFLGKRNVSQDLVSESEINDDQMQQVEDQENEELDAENDENENSSQKFEDEDIFDKDDVEDKWICLRGIETFDKERQVLKMLNRIFQDEKFQFTKISKPKKKNMCFIQFINVEERNRFIEQMKGRKFSGQQKRLKIRPAFKGDKNLKSGIAISILDQQNCAQYQQQLRQQQPQKIASQEDIEQELSIPLEEKVCPLWQTPYDQQVEMKKKDLIDIIKNLQKRAKDKIKSDEITPVWVSRSPEITDFIECEEQYRFNYRNKSEYTIGLNHLGEVKVGYNRTNFEKGIAFIDDASKNCISSKEAVLLARLLEDYINITGLPVYNKFIQVGFWRYFVVRQSFKTKEILLNIVVKTSSCSDQEQLQQIKDGLVNAFQKDNLPPSFDYKIASIGLQHYEAASDSIPQDGQIEIIYGSRSFQENILGKKFDISTNAFLQVHTPQSEKLYNLIGNLTGELNEKTIFLDICSGIGTIGICLANSAKEVIGIEMVETACEDAKINVEQNGVNNYKVICSKVEDVINQIVAPLAGQYKIIGVVDPPRPGLHPNVVKALRQCRGLDHLVYVACNPSAVTDNLLSLCLPESKKRRAPGFHVAKYFGCDLFPQTKHFEAIFYLERFPNQNNQI